MTDRPHWLVPWQHSRELTVNSIEAEAARILVCPDLIECEKRVSKGLPPVYRHLHADDGCGMSGEELKAKSKTLLNPTGQGNFGIGSRLACLYASPQGLRIMSWKKGEGWMVEMWRTPDGHFELRPLPDRAGGTDIVVRAPEKYRRELMFDGNRLIKDHGTVVILLGTDKSENSYFDAGSPEGMRAAGRYNTLYLNTRLFAVPSGVEIRAYEASSLQELPTSFAEASARDRTGTSAKTAGQFRRIDGQEWFLRSTAQYSGSVPVTATVDGKKISATVCWFVRYKDKDPAMPDVMEGRRVNTDPHAIAGAVYDTFSVVHGGEVFAKHEPQTAWHRFKEAHLWFPGSDLVKRLCLIVKVDTGVYQDPARSSLLLNGSGQALPFQQWLEDFAQQMPDELRALAQEAQGELLDSSDIDKLALDFFKKYYATTRLPRPRGFTRAHDEDDDDEDDNRGSGKGKGKKTPPQPPPLPQFRLCALDRDKEHIPAQFDEVQFMYSLNINSRYYKHALAHAAFRYHMGDVSAEDLVQGAFKLHLHMYYFDAATLKADSEDGYDKRMDEGHLACAFSSLIAVEGLIDRFKALQKKGKLD